MPEPHSIPPALRSVHCGTQAPLTCPLRLGFPQHVADQGAGPSFPDILCETMSVALASCLADVRPPLHLPLIECRAGLYRTAPRQLLLSAPTQMPTATRQGLVLLGKLNLRRPQAGLTDQQTLNKG